MRVFLARSAALLSTIFFGVWGAFKLLLDWIGRTTAVDDLNQFLERLPTMVSWVVSTTPWWIPGGLATALTAFLMWAGWPQGRQLPRARRRDAHAELGSAAITLASQITYYVDGPGRWVEPPGHLLSEIYSLMIAFNKQGFSPPIVHENEDPMRKMKKARHYFDIVGRLLRDGHTLEAFEAAKDLAGQEIIVAEDR